MKWLLILAVAVLLAVAIYYYYPAENDNNSDVGTSNNVLMESLEYVPRILTVEAGTEVNFINEDIVDHTVTSNEAIFNSPTLPPGTSFTYQFENAGEFPYYCTIHPQMTGTVVVTEGE